MIYVLWFSSNDLVETLRILLLVNIVKYEILRFIKGVKVHNIFFIKKYFILIRNLLKQTVDSKMQASGKISSTFHKYLMYLHNVPVDHLKLDNFSRGRRFIMLNVQLNHFSHFLCGPFRTARQAIIFMDHKLLRLRYGLKFVRFRHKWNIKLKLDFLN